MSGSMKSIVKLPHVESLDLASGLGLIGLVFAANHPVARSGVDLLRVMPTLLSVGAGLAFDCAE